jgi:hypothetical protein
MSKVSFIVIGRQSTHRGNREAAESLVDKISQGYKIISADSNGIGDVFYILEKKEKEE